MSGQQRKLMRLVLPLLLLALAACAQVKSYKEIDESQISAPVKARLDETRELIRNSQFRPAIAKLTDLQDDKLSPIEKALKYNLKGVSLFGLNEFQKASLNFEVAEKYSPPDTQLFSQVQLNLASAYFKLNQFNELKDRLNKVDRKLLTDAEKKKYAQLALAYGQKVENAQMIVSSAVVLLAEAATMEEILNSGLHTPLKDSFKTLSQKQKVELLEEFTRSKNLAIAYLAQLEAEDRYFSGDKSGAKDVVSWLRNEYGSNEEVRRYIRDFETRLEHSSRISLQSIGLVLPLSGDKASFGQKALSGVDAGLRVMGIAENVKIHTRDSLDSPAQAAQAVLELIREERVAFIVGGLFPESAKAEYLEARKYGVLYISLSQINLPKEEKNHHLIEVQGSIESQVEALLSDEMIRKFGTRIGVLYPQNEGGKAYVDEIWRKSNEKNLQVTSIASFPKNTHDYRETAQMFLGLKFPRERAEELKILEDVYALEKSSIRRVQTLPPVVDFDWVFVATYPHEATQLIPTLGYYDANRLKVIGGPSWVSKSLVKEQRNLGTLYFVGDDPKDLNQEVLNKFQEIYAKPAGLIEVLALDALKIGSEALLAGREAPARDAFDSKLKSAGRLRGLATDWELKDGIWIKRMNAMTITRGEIVKLFAPGT
jgi:tetratricopeptide (TPR) repeat protein